MNPFLSVKHSMSFPSINRGFAACAPWVTVLDDTYQYQNTAFWQASTTEGEKDCFTFERLSEAIEQVRCQSTHGLPDVCKTLIDKRCNAVEHRASRLQSGLSRPTRALIATLSLLCVVASFTIPIVGHDKSLLVQRTATNVRNATLLFDFVWSSMATADRWMDMFIQRILVPAPGLLLYAATLRNEAFYSTTTYKRVNLATAAIAVLAAIAKNAWPLVVDRVEMRRAVRAVGSKDTETNQSAADATPHGIASLSATKSLLTALRASYQLSASGRDAVNALVGDIDALLRLLHAISSRRRAQSSNPHWLRKSTVVLAGSLVAIAAIVASKDNPATLQQTIVWGVYYIWRLVLSACNSSHGTTDTLHIFCQAGAIVMFLLPTLYRDLLVHGPDAMDDYGRRTLALVLTVTVNGTVIHYFGPRGVSLCKAARNAVCSGRRRNQCS